MLNNLKRMIKRFYDDANHHFSEVELDSWKVNWSRPSHLGWKSLLDLLLLSFIGRNRKRESDGWGVQM